MELVAIIAVAHKEHVADEGIQSIAQEDILLTRTTFKSSFHLALRIIFGLHLPNIVVSMVEISVLDLLCILMENSVEHPVGNEWLSE